MRLGSIIAIVLALSTAPAAAAMFKWTDAKGNVQYGDFPPPGVEAERLTPTGVRTPQPQETKSPQERVQEMEQQQQAQDAEAAKAEAAQQQAELKQKNCRTARHNLAALSKGGHRRMRLPDGTVTYLDDAERQRRIDEANQQVKEFCN